MSIEMSDSAAAQVQAFVSGSETEVVPVSTQENATMETVVENVVETPVVERKVKVDAKSRKAFLANEWVSKLPEIMQQALRSHIKDATTDQLPQIEAEFMKLVPATRTARTTGGAVGIHTGTHEAGRGDKLHLVGFNVAAGKTDGATARESVQDAGGNRVTKLWMMRKNVSENVRGSFVMGVTGSDYIIRNCDPALWVETDGVLKATEATDSGKIRRRADAVAEIEARWAAYAKAKKISAKRGAELAEIVAGRVASDLTFR